MSDAAPPAMVDVPAAVDPLARMECLGCGYDLRGRADGDLCPECAHPVAASLAARPLAFADPAWLRTLGRGCALTAVSITCIGLIISISEFIDVASAAAEIFQAACMLVFGAFGATGLWKVVATEPSRAFHRGRRVALAVRAAGVLMVPTAIAIAASLTIDGIVRLTGGTPRLVSASDVLERIADWLFLPYPIAFWLAIACLSRRLRRTHAPFLRRATAWAGPLFSVAMLYECVVSLATDCNILSGRLFEIVMKLSDVMSYATVALMLLIMVLLFACAARLRRLSRPTIAA